MNDSGERNGHPNGSGSGGEPDDFDALIRDRDEDFEWGEPEHGAGGHPRGEYDPYEDFAGRGAYAGGYGSTTGFSDRGLIEAITRIIDALAGVAGEALSPDARRQLEKTLRDLLVALRDALDWMIARIDERSSREDIEIEEIPID